MVSKVLIRKITLEICGPALTVCLSHNPPQPVRVSFLPVPNVLRMRIHLNQRKLARAAILKWERANGA